MSRIRKKSIPLIHENIGSLGLKWNNLNESGTLLRYLLIHGISHLLISKRKQEAESLIQDYEWLLLRIQFKDIKNQQGLEKNYWLLGMLSNSREVSEWNDFVQKYIKTFFSITEKHAELLFQLSYNYAQKSYVGTAALQWLEKQEKEWLWFAKENRTQEPQLSECIHTILDHAGEIDSFLMLSSFKLLYWMKSSKVDTYTLILHEILYKESIIIAISPEPSVWWKKMGDKHVFIQYLNERCILNIENRQQIVVDLPALKSADDLWLNYDGQWNAMISSWRSPEELGGKHLYGKNMVQIYQIDLVEGRTSICFDECDINWVEKVFSQRPAHWKHVEDNVCMVHLPIHRFRWSSSDGVWHDGRLLERKYNFIPIQNIGLAYIEGHSVMYLPDITSDTILPKTLLSMESPILDVYPLNSEELLLVTKSQVIQKFGHNISHVCSVGSLFCTWSASDITLQLWDEEGKILWQKHISQYQENTHIHYILYGTTSKIYFGSESEQQLSIYSKEGSQIDSIENYLLIYHDVDTLVWLTKEKDQYHVWCCEQSTHVCLHTISGVLMEKLSSKDVWIFKNEDMYHIILVSSDVHHQYSISCPSFDGFLYFRGHCLIQDMSTMTFYLLMDRKVIISDNPNLVATIDINRIEKHLFRYREFLFMPLRKKPMLSTYELLVWNVIHNSLILITEEQFSHKDLDETLKELYKPKPEPSLSSKYKIKQGIVYLYNNALHSKCTWYYNISNQETYTIPIGFIDTPKNQRTDSLMSHRPSLRSHFLKYIQDRTNPYHQDPFKRREDIRRYRNFEQNDSNTKTTFSNNAQKRIQCLFSKGVLYTDNQQNVLWKTDNTRWELPSDISINRCISIGPDHLLASIDDNKISNHFSIEWNIREKNISIQSLEKQEKDTSSWDKCNMMHSLRQIHIGDNTFWLPAESIYALNDGSLLIFDNNRRFFHHWIEGQLNSIDRPYCMELVGRTWTFKKQQGKQLDYWILFVQREETEREDPILWNWKTGEQIEFPTNIERNLHLHGAYCLEDNTYLVWFEHRIFLWNPWSKTVEELDSPHLGRILHLQRYANGKFITLGWDEDLFIWDLEGFCTQIGKNANILDMYCSDKNIVVSTDPRTKIFSRFKNYDSKYYIVSEDGTLSPCNDPRPPETETDSFIRTGVHMIQGQKVHITTHEKMVVFDPRITRETFDVEEIFEKKYPLGRRISEKELFQKKTESGYQILVTTHQRKYILLHVETQEIDIIDGYNQHCTFDDLLQDLQHVISLHDEIILSENSIFRNGKAYKVGYPTRKHSYSTGYINGIWYSFEDLHQIRLFDTSTNENSICMEGVGLQPQESFLFRNILFTNTTQQVLSESNLMGLKIDSILSHEAIDIGQGRILVKKSQEIYNDNAELLGGIRFPEGSFAIQQYQDNLFCAHYNELHLFKSIPDGFFTQTHAWIANQHVKGSCSEPNAKIKQCTLFEEQIITLNEMGVIRIWEPSKMRQQDLNENIIGARFLPDNKVMSWQESSTTLYDQAGKILAVDNVSRPIYDIREGYIFFVDGAVLKYGDKMSYSIDHGELDAFLVLLRHLSKSDTFPTGQKEFIELAEEPNPLEPTKILDAKSPDVWLGILNEICDHKYSGLYLAKILSNLYQFLLSPDYVKGKHHKENLCRFLLYPRIEPQSRLLFHRCIANSKNTKLKELVKDPRVALMILDYMELSQIPKKKNTKIKLRNIKVFDGEIYSSPTPWSQRKILGIIDNQIFLQSIEEDIQNPDAGQKYVISKNTILYDKDEKILVRDEIEQKELWSIQLDISPDEILILDQNQILIRLLYPYQSMKYLILDSFSGEIIQQVEAKGLSIAGMKTEKIIQSDDENIFLWLSSLGLGKTASCIQCLHWSLSKKTLVLLTYEMLLSQKEQVISVSTTPNHQGLFQLSKREKHIEFLSLEQSEPIMSWIAPGNWLPHELNSDGRCLFSKGSDIVIAQIMKGVHPCSTKKII